MSDLLKGVGSGNENHSQLRAKKNRRLPGGFFALGIRHSRTVSGIHRAFLRSKGVALPVARRKSTLPTCLLLPPSTLGNFHDAARLCSKTLRLRTFQSKNRIVSLSCFSPLGRLQQVEINLGRQRLVPDLFDAPNDERAELSG